MNATIGNPPIRTAKEFHEQISAALSFPSYYGKNLDALWEVLQDAVERPTQLTWIGSAQSARIMPGDFEKIVAVCREATAEDIKNKIPPFELLLR